MIPGVVPPSPRSLQCLAWWQWVLELVVAPIETVLSLDQSARWLALGQLAASGLKLTPGAPGPNLNALGVAASAKGSRRAERL